MFTVADKFWKLPTPTKMKYHRPLDIAKDGNTGQMIIFMITIFFLLLLMFASPILDYSPNNYSGYVAPGAEKFEGAEEQVQKKYKHEVHEAYNVNMKKTDKNVCCDASFILSDF